MKERKEGNSEWLESEKKIRKKSDKGRVTKRAQRRSGQMTREALQVVMVMVMMDGNGDSGVVPSGVSGAVVVVRFSGVGGTGGRAEGGARGRRQRAGEVTG